MDERPPIRQWMLAVAGLLMVVASVAIVRRDRASAPAAQAAPLTRTSLYVDRDGGAMRLHWNPDSPDVRGASRGAILIHDGKRESRLDLTPRDLRAGAASYWPESKEVSFRFELNGAEAGAVRASAPPDDRPSPFETAQTPRKKSYPIKRVQAQITEPEPEVKRESGLGRAIGKIPLLRRLRKEKH